MESKKFKKWIIMIIIIIIIINKVILLLNCFYEEENSIFHLSLYQSYFKVAKTITLNAKYYFILKIPNKRELQQIASRNVRKYGFLTGKDVLPKKDLLGKAATTKRFEYLLLSKESKAQTDIAKKQYQN